MVQIKTAKERQQMPNYFNPYNQYGYYNQQPQQLQNMQMNNGGLISIPSEYEARNYPVAYGNSVIFKDEREPYIYVKTMGFSQLDSPTFDKYRLVKEGSQNGEIEPKITKESKSKYEELKAEIEAIKSHIRALEDRRVRNDEYVPAVHAESTGDVKKEV